MLGRRQKREKWILLAPALAGVVFTAWGREWPYFIGAMFLAVAGIGALRLMRDRAANPG